MSEISESSVSFATVAVVVGEDKSVVGEDKSVVGEDKSVVTNVAGVFDNLELIGRHFKQAVEGYHLINASPINEATWEDINALAFTSSGIDVYSKSDGSHLSGMDIHCSLGKISNKSAKYSKNRKTFDISSYRLTSVCSEKQCGTPAEIIEEIYRRKNFDYYSFIVRNENSAGENIEYDWMLIPSNYPALDPSAYTWEPMIGKVGKNKDTQIGWKTNEICGCRMTITFSMSSQLWIHLEMTEEMKKFIVASATASKTPKYNYIDLLTKLH